MAPGSNSIVATAAVDPTTKIVATPEAILDLETAVDTMAVMSWASLTARGDLVSMGVNHGVVE